MSKKILSFLASTTLFKYAQNEGFAFKKFKIFRGGGACPQTPLACSDRFTVLTGDTFTPGLPDFLIWGPRWLLPIKVNLDPCCNCCHSRVLNINI